MDETGKAKTRQKSTGVDVELLEELKPRLFYAREYEVAGIILYKNAVGVFLIDSLFLQPASFRNPKHHTPN